MAHVRRVVLGGFLLVCGLGQLSAAQDRVVVPVSVTGPRNSIVSGLKQESFRIFEENKEQKIASFSPDNNPSSIGIVLGASALAGRKDTVSESIRAAIVLFQKSGHPDSEYFIEPYGADEVNTVVLRGLSTLMRGKHAGKALVVVMDAFDNPGGNPEQPSMERPMRQDVPIYFLYMRGIGDGSRYGNWLTVFGDVARNTGGRLTYAEPLGDLNEEAVKLAEELKGRYLIGFQSTNTAQDGKWRSLRVTVNTPPGQPKPNVRHRSRYFVPKVEK